MKIPTNDTARLNATPRRLLTVPRATSRCSHPDVEPDPDEANGPAGSWLVMVTFVGITPRF